MGVLNILLIETPWVDGENYLKYVNETYPEKKLEKPTRNEELAAIYAQTGMPLKPRKSSLNEEVGFNDLGNRQRVNF